MNLFDDALRNLRAAEPPPFEQRRSLRAAELQRDERPHVHIDELAGIIQRTTAAYLAEPNPGRALLLALPAGSGKTTQMVRLAEGIASQDRRVLYTGPRHDLFLDLMQMAERPDWWYHWQPRRQGDEHNPGTCRWAVQMDRWLSRGYEAMKFCTNDRICGWNYVNNECVYHAQKQQQKHIIYAMHQHVAVGHPLMEKSSVLIGDELPLNAMLHTWLIPSPYIVIANPDRELERVLWTLRNLCDTKPPEGGWSGPQLIAALGGAAHLLDLLQNHEGFRLGADFLSPHLESPDHVERTDYLFLPTLLSLLEQEAKASLAGEADWIRRIHCTPEGLKLLLRRRPKVLPPHVIWCDATGDARMYERLLGLPVEEVRPNVAMRGRVFQIYTSLNNRTALGEKPDAPKIIALNAQVARIRDRGQYQNSRLITFKLHKDLFNADGHFGAERGTNRYADADALIVIGTPQPSQSQIVEVAAMLYDERLRPFDERWTSREVPFDGRANAYPVSGFWDDPDLHLVLQQLREAELVQTLHRARPLRREVDIWLLTNLPLPGIAVDLMSVSQLFDAPEGVDPYRWPKVLKWAVDRLDTHGMILATDVAEHVGISPPAARMYLYTLAGQLNLTVSKIAGLGPGHPRLAIAANPSVKDYQDRLKESAP